MNPKRLITTGATLLLTGLLTTKLGQTSLKTNLLLTLLLSIAGLTTATVRAQSSDESAIRTVIDNARAAFDKRDLNTFASYFVNSPDLYYQVATADHQIILAHGIGNMKKMVGGYFQAVPTPAAAGSYTLARPAVRINGNTALVTGSGDGGNEKWQDFAVLEKIGGSWKITALTSQNYQAGKFTEVK